MNRNVLFAGFRGGALAAARRLGLGVFGVGPPLPRAVRDEVDGWASRSFDSASDEIERAVRELLDGRRVDGVVALTEAGVQPAAELRARLRLPGDDIERALLASDKLAMKQAARAAGVPITPWVALDGARGADELASELGLPVVLKLARSSGGRGSVVCGDVETLRRELPGRDIAEAWIDGVEMSVESLVVDGEARFVNPTEYLVVRHANVLPAELAPETLARVLDLNRAVLAAVGPRNGIAHVELYLTSSGELFGEIAARPPGGRLMECLERAYGFDFWECVLRLALGERPALPGPVRQCAGAWILHPGAGRVVAVEGLQAAREVEGVKRCRLKVRAGDVVAEREGSGQDIGRIEVVGRDRDAVVHALRAAHGRLVIRMEPC